jgi:hypothetical protein
VLVVKTRLGVSDVLWMAAGAAGLLVFMLVMLHLRRGQDPAAQAAFRAQRADVVGRMQLDLALGSEAEKSAVLAVTDSDSQTFADQARADSTRVEQERRELEELLTTGGTQDERESLTRFTAAFADLQRIDGDLLALAVKNTNVKAYGLAFGPAATALDEMNAALARLVAHASADPDSSETRTTISLAFGAQVGALRIQALLPRHIAEESDPKMDELEASMAADDAQVRKDLDGLAAVPRLHDDRDLAVASARYADYSQLRRQILPLSRENTNVRSLSISLNQKRSAMLVCQSALGALQQAVQQEPMSGTASETPVRPR